jgi:hypothetical protein
MPVDAANGQTQVILKISIVSHFAAKGRLGPLVHLWYRRCDMHIDSRFFSQAAVSTVLSSIGTEGWPREPSAVLAPAGSTLGLLS